MIPILLFLIIISILGRVVYVHLRQEQDKVIAPQDNYDAAWNKFYKNTSYLSRTSSRPLDRHIIFLATYALFPPFVILFFGIVDSGSIMGILDFIGLSFYILLLSPLYLFIFPIGLMNFIIPGFNNEYAFLIGWTSYIVIWISGIFVQDRRVFTVIYLIFIALLVVNMIGCTRIEIDLSVFRGLN